MEFLLWIKVVFRNTTVFRSYTSETQPGIQKLCRIQKLDIVFRNYHWGCKTLGIWISKPQPLSATRVAASGRKWPQGAARASGRKWLQWAARASGHSGLLGIGLQTSVPIALLLKPWKKVFPRKIFFNLPCNGILGAARASGLAATCSHLQPLAATRVAASSRLKRKEGSNE